MPLAAYLISQVSFTVAVHWLGLDWLDPATRIRWDGHIYLDIAHTGYYAGPCPEINPMANNPDGFCGNAGWFPLYPLVVLALSVITSLSLEISAVVISEACAVGILAIVWHLTRDSGTTRRISCLVIAALIPSGVYYHATFPMSLTVLLILIAFLLLSRGRWIASGLVGTAAAAAYPLGVLVAPAGAMYYLAQSYSRSRRPVPEADVLSRSGYLGVTAAAGTLLAFSAIFVGTGRFDAYLKIQTTNYGHGFNNPLATLQTVFTHARTEVVVECVFSIVLVALAVSAVLHPSRRGRASHLDIALATVYGPLLLLVPLIVGANQAQFRSHTLLLPLVVPLRHLPTPVLVATAATALPISFAMSLSFLRGSLV